MKDNKLEVIIKTLKSKKVNKILAFIKNHKFLKML